VLRLDRWARSITAGTRSLMPAITPDLHSRATTVCCSARLWQARSTQRDRCAGTAARTWCPHHPCPDAHQGLDRLVTAKDSHHAPIRATWRRHRSRGTDPRDERPPRYRTADKDPTTPALSATTASTRSPSSCDHHRVRDREGRLAERAQLGRRLGASGRSMSWL